MTRRADRQIHHEDITQGTGIVFTAEGPETFLENRGWISLEDDAPVTTSGSGVLATQQRGLWLIL